MVPAQEIQLGNWVYAFKGCWQIDTTDFTHVDPDTGNLPYDPIPITKEILNKTNLSNERTALWCTNEEVHERVKGDIGKKYCSFWFNSRLNQWMEVQSRVTVDYVHQLQNLYFWHTKELLQIQL